MPSSRFFLRPLLAATCLALSSTSIAIAETPRELTKAEFSKAATGPLTFESAQEAPASDIWRSLAKAYDFDVVFSPKMLDPKIEIRVHNATLGEVLDRLAITGDHFWRPLDERTVLVASDTPQQRRAYEPQVVQTVRLENIRVADAMTALRSIYGLKHITADEGRRTITVRDLASKVEMASTLLSRLDVPEDEVTVRLELMRVPEETWRQRTSNADLLRAARVESMMSADLGIVGRRGARFDVEERAESAGDRLAVGVKIEARVHPASGEVTLALDSHLAEIDATSGDVAGSKKARSSWRLKSGETHLVELPGGLGSGDDGTVLALALTPEILQASSQEHQALWISAEVPFSMGAAPSSPEAREEVRKRLRKRLAELPRGVENAN